MLSFVRALASGLSAPLTNLGLNWERNSSTTLSISRCAYHTSSCFIAANSAIAVRYRPTVSSTIRSCSLARKPLSRAAINMLTARPLNVPLPPPLGRREHPEVRQVRIPAALHRQPRPRRRGKITRHDYRRPAIERKRRHEHPPVADRDQFWDACLSLAFEQLHRIGPSRQRLKHRMTRPRHLCPRRPCHARPAPPPTDAAPPRLHHS